MQSCQSKQLLKLLRRVKSKFYYCLSEDEQELLDEAIFYLKLKIKKTKLEQPKPNFFNLSFLIDAIISVISKISF